MTQGTGGTAAKVAGGLSVTLGLGFGLPAAVGAWHFARHDEVWTFLGFPTYGEGPFEAAGVPTSVPLLVGFGAVCTAEVIDGVGMWRGSRRAVKASFALLPFELLYWWGFALPFGPILGAGRTAAAIAALRKSSEVRGSLDTA